MGKFIRLDGVNPAADRPKIDIIDPVLPSAGALYLFEFGHPLSQFPAGAPANGQTLRNIARDQAAVVTGGAVSAMDASMVINAYPSGSAIIERTSKGGVHSIHSQSSYSTAGMNVPVPLAILNYLAANPTHSIYGSIWARITRQGDSTQSVMGVSFAATPAANQVLMLVSQDGTNYPAAARIGHRRVPAGAWRPAQQPGLAPAPLFADIGVTGYTGTVESSRKGKAMGIQIGDPYPGTGTASSIPSMVFYRGYMEDLTVSGRTYADVDAIDYATFQAEVLTAGGRYYNDTYTSPSTLA